MTDPLPSLHRRPLLGLIASLPWLAWAGTASAAPRTAPSKTAAATPAPEPSGAFPDSALLVVAGPEGGRIDRWARFIAPPLERALPPGTSLQPARSGGIDGVTGANKFDARVVPDGSTALLVPGTAALAWLAGDPRAQFDAAHWVPVMAGATPGVVVGRVGFRTFAAGQTLRIAAASAGGADMTALLALDLLGVQAVPVLGGGDESASAEALAQHAVDAVFLHGARVPQRVNRLVASGARPLFTLGDLDETGAMVRDPMFPEVPHVTELFRDLRGGPPAGPLLDAWRATAAAAQLEFGLVLPQLTPAGRVALWRHAAAQAAASPEVRAACVADAIRPLATPRATAFTSGIATNAEALLELRRWLAARYNWQPA